MRSDPELHSMADLAALTAMFEEHRPRLEVMLRGRIDPALAGRLDAADLLQEAFLRAPPVVAPLRRLGDVGLRLAVSDRPGLPDRRLAPRDPRGRDPHREMPWPEQSSVQLGLSLVGTGTTPQAVAAESCGSRSGGPSTCSRRRPGGPLDARRRRHPVPRRRGRAGDLGEHGHEAVLAGQPTLRDLGRVRVVGERGE